MRQMDTAGHFTSPSAEECRQLVRSHAVGRVAWVSNAGLQVLPVAYRCNGELICFRVNAASILGELATRTEVAFEVDDIDVATATGWSVLVRGVATAHDGEGLELPLPWAPGHRDLVIAIQPSAYSSRAVSAELERS